METNRQTPSRNSAGKRRKTKAPSTKSRQELAPILNATVDDSRFGNRRARTKGGVAGTTWLISKELSPSCSKYSLKSAAQLQREGSSGSFLATFRLGLDAAATSDGSGILATVYGNSPSSAQNWSGYAGVFDEYRVLAHIVKFEPLRATGGSTQTFWAPIAHVVDRSDATALTGYGLAERYDSHHKAPGQTRWSSSWVMNSIEEAPFVSTASPASNSWIKVYSSGNSASFTLGRVDVVYIVQFRGLGIN